MALTIDLSDQAVLVTGGTGGIGRGVVEAMLEAGARVALCAPDQEECDAVRDQLGQHFPANQILARAADLHDRASLSALVAETMSTFGRIDTLVANAADFGRPAEIEDLDLDIYVRVLQANVVNNFQLCREVVGQMLERGSGSIILMTSITGYTTMPTNLPYSSSKAAIASMARSMAAKYAEKGVRVNCVSPGLIKTEASRDIWGDDELARSYIADKIPAQRIGHPRDIAGMCVFLASELSEYVTAATLPVDGGRLGVGQLTGTNAQVAKQTDQEVKA